MENYEKTKRMLRLACENRI